MHDTLNHLLFASPFPALCDSGAALNITRGLKAAPHPGRRRASSCVSGFPCESAWSGDEQGDGGGRGDGGGGRGGDGEAEAGATGAAVAAGAAAAVETAATSGRGFGAFSAQDL